VKQSYWLSIAIQLALVILALGLLAWSQATAFLPAGLGLALLLVVGAVAGGVVNFVVSASELAPRAIGPWHPAPAGCRPRTWLDRLPIVAWLRLRREARQQGAGFWIRPLLVELLLGAGCVLLFIWEVRDGNLLPATRMFGAAAANQFPTENLVAATATAFVAQMTLIVLMAAASLVDIDEKVIPDEITVPGTLIGLAWAGAYPWSLPPAAAWTGAAVSWELGPAHLAAPNPFPAVLGEWQGLALALACWWGWCLALAPWRWYGRHGLGRAVAIVTARVLRDPMTRLGLVGTPVIALFWWLAPAAHWAGLLSSLVGMAAGGAIVWGVRIVGTSMLRQEAMGFGDVTLLAMIGAFLGWQATPLVFFLAPLAGVVIAVGQWLLNRRNEIFFGPFLCLAAVVVIVFWRPMWASAALAFHFGWLVPAGLAACLVMLGLMLRFWLWFRWAVLGRDD
jgi:leader peptidase (prepilin peptidase) / N-methyltransferase